MIALTGFGPAAGLLYMRGTAAAISVSQLYVAPPAHCSCSFFLPLRLGLFGGAPQPPPRPADPAKAQALSAEVEATAARQEAALLRLENEISSGTLRLDRLSLNDPQQKPSANGSHDKDTKK